MNLSRSVLLPVVAGLVAVQASCKTGPDYTRPPVSTPETWRQLPDATSGNGESPVDLSEWWILFQDAVLTDLIHQAMEDSLDLKTAFMRIEEAAAVRGIARGDYLPAVQGFGDASSTRVSDLSGGDQLTDRTREIYSVGLDASWEVDLWGRIRRSVESADASLQASIEDYRDTLVLLCAQIANNYLSVRELQMRIRLLKENIANQDSTRRLTQGRYDAGLVPALDVHQAELNLSRTRSALPLLRQQLAVATHRLAVLTGKAPGHLAVSLAETEDLSHPDMTLPVGLPADLLRQRPDVRRAEQQLIAQTAKIGVAKADLLPRLSLSGSFALEADDAGRLGESGSQTYRFGPSLRWALFQGGRIRSNIQAEEARTEQAMLQYQQSVLLALEDVENAFVSFAEEKDRLDAIRNSVESAAKSVSQVQSLYENGLVNFLNVLDAERSLAEQQDLLAQSAGQLNRNLVGIYRSLGGGWQLSPTHP